MYRYKYLLIYDRNKQIIYGECIKWRCGEFDSLKRFDTTINLKKKFQARFITSEEPIDSINKDKKIIKIKNDISFSYEEEDRDFITLRFDEELFNPLIDRCSKIKMFFGYEISNNNYLSWIKEHKSLLEEMKTRFSLDILKRPELINSYIYYEPNPITVKCKFIDKSTCEGNNSFIKLKVNFYDEFTIYTQAKYMLTSYFENKEPQVKEGKVSEGSTIIYFDLLPDKLKIEIFNKNICIYSTNFDFLENICLGLKLVGGTVSLNNSSKVSIYNESTINIGEK